MRPPRFQLRTLMVAVAAVGAAIGLTRWYVRAEKSAYARHLAAYYGRAEREALNDPSRAAIADWRRKMEYYAAHPDESPYGWSFSYLFAPPEPSAP